MGTRFRPGTLQILLQNENMTDRILSHLWNIDGGYLRETDQFVPPEVELESPQNYRCFSKVVCNQRKQYCSSCKLELTSSNCKFTSW